MIVLISSIFSKHAGINHNMIKIKLWFILDLELLLN